MQAIDVALKKTIGTWMEFHQGPVRAKYYSQFLGCTVKMPLSIPLTAINKLGAVFSRKLKREIFVDHHQTMYDPEAGDYTTIIASGIIVTSEFWHALKIDNSNTGCLPRIPPPDFTGPRNKKIDGTKALEAMGKLSAYS